jgi:hypothetical protein
MAIDKTSKPWLANNNISKESAHDPWNPPELAEEFEDDLIDNSTPFDARERTDEEIENYDLGVEAGLAGKPNDTTKCAAWQRGWADAQE